MTIKVTKFDVRLVKDGEADYKALKDETVKEPQSAARLFNNVLDMNLRMQEVFAICTLDVKSNVTGVFEVTTGGLSRSIVHPREVFQRALLQGAARIILCHNHPSGNPEPSKEDIKITKRLQEVGGIMGIEVLDHIVIGDSNHLSMRERGDI